ncbi:MAG: glucuronate isomerase [Ginsengibacter sp.]
MKAFLDKDFLLHSETAKKLYHDFAKDLPIIDYHNHLPVEQIASDINFENITQVWLYGDHYKWRAMRTNGIDESYCTGDKSDNEKFIKWAATVPYTLRNPLYHWTHLELQRYFDIHELLTEESAQGIYDECSKKLQTKEYSVRNLLRKMNVKMLCTTDDPIDSLEHHKKIRDDGFEIKVLPAFRPDKAMSIENAAEYKSYLTKLEQASGVNINSFPEFLKALKQRHDFFSSMGCSVSDHGLEYIPAEDYTTEEINAIFKKVLNEQAVSSLEIAKYKSAVLYKLALWDHEKGWVQQYHLGAIRNNNSRMLNNNGADAGCDSIGDFSQAKTLSKFLDRLDATNQLAKTILYNLNPADNELMATMAGNFNDGSIAGKIQFGAAWWFLDQKDGMTKQLNTLSNMGLLSRMVGMLTDSRSFLSFPRHEYFRRILCNLLGDDIENGELPNDLKRTGKIVQDICYYNCVNYFDLKKPPSS